MANPEFDTPEHEAIIDPLDLIEHGEAVSMILDERGADWETDTMPNGVVVQRRRDKIPLLDTTDVIVEESIRNGDVRYRVVRAGLGEHRMWEWSGVNHDDQYWTDNSLVVAEGLQDENGRPAVVPYLTIGRVYTTSRMAKLSEAIEDTVKTTYGEVNDGSSQESSDGSDHG